MRAIPWTPSLSRFQTLLNVLIHASKLGVVATGRFQNHKQNQQTMTRNQHLCSVISKAGRAAVKKHQGSFQGHFLVLVVSNNYFLKNSTHFCGVLWMSAAQYFNDEHDGEYLNKYQTKPLKFWCYIASKYKQSWSKIIICNSKVWNTCVSTYISTKEAPMHMQRATDKTFVLNLL